MEAQAQMTPFRFAVFVDPSKPYAKTLVSFAAYWPERTFLQTTRTSAEVENEHFEILRILFEYEESGGLLVLSVWSENNKQV